MQKIHTGDKIAHNGTIYYVRYQGSILYLYSNLKHLISKHCRKKVIPNINICLVKSNKNFTPPLDWDEYTEESDGSLEEGEQYARAT